MPSAETAPPLSGAAQYCQRNWGSQTPHDHVANREAHHWLVLWRGLVPVVVLCQRRGRAEERPSISCERLAMPLARPGPVLLAVDIAVLRPVGRHHHDRVEPRRCPSGLIAPCEIIEVLDAFPRYNSLPPQGQHGLDRRGLEYADRKWEPLAGLKRGRPVVLRLVSNAHSTTPGRLRLAADRHLCALPWLVHPFRRCLGHRRLASRARVLLWAMGLALVRRLPHWLRSNPT